MQGPLWGLPQDAYASSGLSDSMSPGNLSKLSLNDAVAFRVTFDGPTPPRTHLYWRGPVLWNFDGTTWTRGSNTAKSLPTLEGVSQPVDYTVTLEPHNKHWLFALDMPGKLSIPADITADFQLLSHTPVTARLRYRASSWLNYRAGVDEPAKMLRRALILPSGLNPQARQLAQQWRAQYPDDMDYIRAVLAHFSQGGYLYTLQPPRLGRHSVDEFLFTTRQGFCEHYASSFVFLLRAAGIPARVVTGYHGGEYNALGNYTIVRQSDAHAWAEAWLGERGWVRFDPTAAIAPARIESGLSSAVANPELLPFMVRNPPSWLVTLRLNWDALTNQWNQWVLGYNPERQFAFLTRLGMEDITWQKMALIMLAGIFVLVGIFTSLLLRRLVVHSRDPVQAAWLKLCRKLEKAGLPRAPHEGPLDYAARVAAERPHLSASIHALAAHYVALRYHPQHDMRAVRAFRRLVATFKL